MGIGSRLKHVTSPSGLTNQGEGGLPNHQTYTQR